MAGIRIPDELAGMVRERRVIPFVGAGFSAGHGLPGWDDLLKKVATALRVGDSDPALTYEEIRDGANEDFLRVAEYLYIRAGKSIGPLRLSLTTALQATQPFTDSTSHVELVNLGAPQVYTTNFDDLIEETYRALAQPVEIVALSRDVALADANQSQVVKYHGDLRYDNTLVLTESQYYTRLDFESPMDLKFRSDLLGRSVLFMGYSFRDVNIRVIWFKPMQMMRDVPKEDRPPSYIVRLEPNPVLEALFADVGLKTIVLDPECKATAQDDRNRLVGDFMTALAAAASPQGVIPGRTQRMFATTGLLDGLREEFERRQERGPYSSVPNHLRHLTTREVPAPLSERALEVLGLVAKDAAILYSLDIIKEVIEWALRTWGPRHEATFLAARTICRTHIRENFTQDSNVDWTSVWSGGLEKDEAVYFLRIAERELNGHENQSFVDDDLAYVLDVTARIAGGLTADEEAQQTAQEILMRAAELYPVVSDYVPEPQPNLAPILEAIEEARGGAPSSIVSMDEIGS